MSFAGGSSENARASMAKSSPAAGFRPHAPRPSPGQADFAPVGPDTAPRIRETRTRSGRRRRSAPGSRQSSPRPRRALLRIAIERLAGRPVQLFDVRLRQQALGLMLDLQRDHRIAIEALVAGDRGDGPVEEEVVEQLDQPAQIGRELRTRVGRELGHLGVVVRHADLPAARLRQPWPRFCGERGGAARDAIATDDQPGPAGVVTGALHCAAIGDHGGLCTKTSPATRRGC